MSEAILQVANLMLSNALLYRGPLNSTLPANTVPFGGSWGGAWSRVGFTNAPLKFGYTYEVADADIEESLSPVNRMKRAESATIETVMAEIHLGLLPYPWEGSFLDIPQSSGVPASEQYDVGGLNSLTKSMWGFEGQWIKDSGEPYPVRFFLWRGTPVVGSELTWTKTAFVNGTTLRIGALADMNRPAGQRLVRAIRVTSAPGA